MRVEQKVGNLDGHFTLLERTKDDGIETLDVVGWMRPSAACEDMTTHPMY